MNAKPGGCLHLDITATFLWLADKDGGSAEVSFLHLGDDLCSPGRMMGQHSSLLTISLKITGWQRHLGGSVGWASDS